MKLLCTCNLFMSQLAGWAESGLGFPCGLWQVERKLVNTRFQGNYRRGGLDVGRAQWLWVLEGLWAGWVFTSEHIISLPGAGGCFSACGNMQSRSLRQQWVLFSSPSSSWLQKRVPLLCALPALGLKAQGTESAPIPVPAPPQGKEGLLLAATPAPLADGWATPPTGHGASKQNDAGLAVQCLQIFCLPFYYPFPIIYLFTSFPD